MATKVTVVTQGQTLVLTSAVGRGNAAMTLYSNAARTAAITLPLTFAADQDLFFFEEWAALTVTQPDGTALGAGAVFNVDRKHVAGDQLIIAPVPTLLQVADDDSTLPSAYAPFLITQTTQTASYTYVLADGGTLVEYNSSSAGTLTVPPNSSVAFPIGTTISGRQLGAGLATVVAGLGVTIDSRGAALKSAGQYAEWNLTKRGTNEWVLSGDIST